MKGTAQARKILQDFQPNLVIGTGGFVCGPVVFTAKTLGIPSYIHEMDAYPGLTNRFLSRFATVVGVSFEGAVPYFGGDRKKVKLLGNPRATEVLQLTDNRKQEWRSRNLLDPSKQTLVIVSGSRGASGINKAVIEALPALTKRRNLQIVYCTGQVHFDQVSQSIRRLCLPDLRRLHVVPFEYDMPALLSCTDLIVSRAGGTTIAELTALGVPAIYIPSPYVTNNHQEYNAREIVQSGGGILLQEKTLTGEILQEQIFNLLDHPEKLKQMRASALAVGKPRALPEIYETLLSIAKK